MKILCKILAISVFVLNILISSHAAGTPASAAPQLPIQLFTSNHFKPTEELFRFAPGQSKPFETPSPELYIDRTVRYGLNLVLPQTIQKGLNFGAGYDRWEGLPTVSADYFLPVKAWSDKSIFFSPRVNLTSKCETFSVGAGIRHLITSEAVVGFHAFHDWVRPRRSGGEFLKEAGVGLEIAALPGRYSDLSLSVNAYFPVNRKRSVAADGTLLVKESLPAGLDARMAFLLPALIKPLDIRMNARVHSYTGEGTDITGYRGGLTFSSRDGMLTASVEHGKDGRTVEEFRVEGSITLAFDWVDLLKGSNPFSAPYQASSMRFNRKVRDTLYDRVVRKHDLPTDRTESRLALLASVQHESVIFRGGFPELPNAKLTVQVSQSPWRDCSEVITDSQGFYSGHMKLKPGTYMVRLIHKPTGQVSQERRIVISE